MQAQALARALRGQTEEPIGRRPFTVLVDVTGRSANAQMKWASKTGARWSVFVPPGAEGYAVRDMSAGKDLPPQRTVQDLKRWLIEQVERAEPAHSESAG
jgi:hypothetical protein